MKITKIIVLSDIHGNVKLMEKILNTNNYDYSVIAGDFVCSDSIINKYFDYAVRGNNDWDSNLKDEIDFEINGISFHLEHGHLTGSYFQLDNYEYMQKQLISRNCDVFIHGHTHIPKIFEYEKGMVINPGSPTFPRGGSTPSYAIITIDENKVVECKIINL